jgi:hypothetical protein
MPNVLIDLPHRPQAPAQQPIQTLVNCPQIDEVWSLLVRILQGIVQICEPQFASLHDFGPARIELDRDRIQ